MVFIVFLKTQHGEGEKRNDKANFGGILPSFSQKSDGSGSLTFFCAQGAISIYGNADQSHRSKAHLLSQVWVALNFLKVIKYVLQCSSVFVLLASFTLWILFIIFALQYSDYFLVLWTSCHIFLWNVSQCSLWVILLRTEVFCAIVATGGLKSGQIWNICLCRKKPSNPFYGQITLRLYWPWFYRTQVWSLLHTHCTE